MSDVIDLTCSTCEARQRGTYTLPAACRNCGWTGYVRLSRGHERPIGAECPVCGCRNVRAAHGAWSTTA